MKIIIMIIITAIVTIHFNGYVNEMYKNAMLPVNNINRAKIQHIDNKILLTKKYDYYCSADMLELSSKYNSMIDKYICLRYGEANNIIKLIKFDCVTYKFNVTETLNYTKPTVSHKFYDKNLLTATTIDAYFKLFDIVVTNMCKSNTEHINFAIISSIHHPNL